MPKIPFWVFIIIAVVYCIAIGVDTMDIDASQYAGMSREMTKSSNWLQLYDRGLEYLDKPPFLFWVSAASMKVFGINNFAYKLPSLLFALWALWATYRLTRLLYTEATARLAALILGTCQGMFLMTNDVRCDTILMSWVVTAIWMVKEWEVTHKRKYLFAGFAAAAFGMMTKGPIALMVPAFAFTSQWVLHRDWKKFTNANYLLGIVIVAILLLPVSIGLYQQFDLHPNKRVNGTTGVSGLRFFYWSQSFGRITGESPWKNGADISFLLLNMLWSFLPWIFIFIPAFVTNTVLLVRQKFRLQTGQEWIATGGFLLAYLALGSSAYQLPHYIFVAFPLAAIVTAASVAHFYESGRQPLLYKVLRPTLTVISLLVLGLVLYLIAYVFPAGPWAIVLWVVGVALWVFIALQKNTKGTFVLSTAAAMLIANVFLSGYIYPSLLRYQAGSQVGRYLKTKGLPTNECIIFKMRDPMNALSFYSGNLYPFTDTVTEAQGYKYVVTMAEGLADLRKQNKTYHILLQGSSFKVSELTPAFLNPKTRHTALQTYYIVQLSATN